MGFISILGFFLLLSGCSAASYHVDRFQLDNVLDNCSDGDIIYFTGPYEGGFIVNKSITLMGADPEPPGFRCWDSETPALTVEKPCNLTNFEIYNYYGPGILLKASNCNLTGLYIMSCYPIIIEGDNNLIENSYLDGCQIIDKGENNKILNSYIGCEVLKANIRLKDLQVQGDSYNGLYTSPVTVTGILENTGDVEGYYTMEAYLDDQIIFKQRFEVPAKGTEDFRFTCQSKPGTHQLRLKEEILTLQWLDKPPLVDILPNPGLYHEPITVVIKACDDDLETPTLEVNGKTFNGEASILLKDPGTYTIRYKAVDSGGQTSEGTLTYTIKSDAIATINISSTLLESQPMLLNWYKLLAILAGPPENGIYTLQELGNAYTLADTIISQEMLWLSVNTRQLYESPTRQEMEEAIREALLRKYNGEELIIDLCYRLGLSDDMIPVLEEAPYNNTLMDILYELLWEPIQEENLIKIKYPWLDPDWPDNTKFWQALLNYQMIPETLLQYFLPYIPSYWVISKPLQIQYPLVLNSPVKIISATWKRTKPFEGQLNIIVDGKIIASHDYINAAYMQIKPWLERVNASEFYNTIVSILGLLKLNNQTETEQGRQLWQINQLGLEYLNNLTGVDVHNYTLQHLEELISDTLQIKIDYPGEPRQTINGITFGGTPIIRKYTIYHIKNFNGTYNGAYNDPELGMIDAGYQGIASYTIATTKISDNILEEWLQKKPSEPGPLKAAYGTGLAALEMIYLHDRLAEEVATRYNITWTRGNPIIVSVVDIPEETFMTLECDHNMGVEAKGVPENLKAFNYARTSTINLFEFLVMQRLFPPANITDLDLDQIMSSGVTTDIAYRLMTGQAVNITVSGNYTIINYGSEYLLIDAGTGIVRDVDLSGSWMGAYCFSHLQTEWAAKLAGELLNGTDLLKAMVPCVIGSACVFEFGEGCAALLAADPILLVPAAIILDLYWIMEQPDIAIPINLVFIQECLYPPPLAYLMDYYVIRALISGETPSNLIDKDQEILSKTALIITELAKGYNGPLTRRDIQRYIEENLPTGGLGDDPDRMWGRVGENLRELWNQFKEDVKNGNWKGAATAGAAIGAVATVALLRFTGELLESYYKFCEKIEEYVKKNKTGNSSQQTMREWTPPTIINSSQ